MAKTDNLSDFLTDVANSIRTKIGTSEQINAQDFSDKILSIPNNGFAQKKYFPSGIASTIGATSIDIEHETRDATYSNSIKIEDPDHQYHDYYYFATITASKMYYNGTEFPEQQLRKIGSLDLLYYNGSTGFMYNDSTVVFMYREGNTLYLTFEADKNTIKVSGIPRSLATNVIINFSDDAVVTKQTPTYSAPTTYTYVIGTTLIDIQWNASVFAPVDATKYFGSIQFYYDRDTYYELVSVPTFTQTNQ